LLGILHYVLAGLSAVGALVAFILMFDMAFSIMLLTAALPTPPAPLWGLAPDFAWVFIGIGAFTMVSGATLALLTFLAGRFIARRRHRGFILAISLINCFSVPLGTMLGVYTMIVLSRPSVKAEFEKGTL
jgi:hypothetical protein